MSAEPIPLSSSVTNLDFSDSDSVAFGSGPMKELESGVFGLFAADSNLDGQVTANDFNDWLADTKAVESGYLQTDFNLDLQVTASDFNLWLVNTKRVAKSKVP
jgi:hypothetical protein